MSVDTAGDLHLSAVRHGGVSEAGVLQAAERVRGGTAQYRVWRRHRHLPGGHQHLYHRHTRPTGLPLGLTVPGRL